MDALAFEPILISTESVDETLFLIIELTISTPEPSTTLSPILLLLNITVFITEVLLLEPPPLAIPTLAPGDPLAVFS